MRTFTASRGWPISAGTQCDRVAQAGNATTRNPETPASRQGAPGSDAISASEQHKRVRQAAAALRWVFKLPRDSSFRQPGTGELRLSNAGITEHARSLRAGSPADRANHHRKLETSRTGLFFFDRATFSVSGAGAGTFINLLQTATGRVPALPNATRRHGGSGAVAAQLRSVFHFGDQAEDVPDSLSRINFRRDPLRRHK